jgi:hypothetical protein
MSEKRVSEMTDDEIRALLGGRQERVPDEVYLAAALAQQAVWRPDEDRDYQRRIAERMAQDPPFRVAVEVAYRAGLEARHVSDSPSPSEEGRS